ncbi:MAG: hypothetical protein LBP92_08635 [Deltaproteobacteria bacterium]|nr:hypothetical protein [Deltaproteobacteria bacterium]
MAAEELVWGRLRDPGQACRASKRFRVHGSLIVLNNRSAQGDRHSSAQLLPETGAWHFRRPQAFYGRPVSRRGPGCGRWPWPWP